MSKTVNFLIGLPFLLLSLSTVFYTKQDQTVAAGPDKIIRADTTDSSIAAGKKIFEGKCAACHTIFQDKTGPALAGVSDRWPDKKELFDFVKTPALVIVRNEYAKKLKEKYRLPHPAYSLSDEEIQNVLDYIKDEEEKK